MFPPWAPFFGLWCSRLWVGLRADEPPCGEHASCVPCRRGGGRVVARPRFVPVCEAGLSEMPVQITLNRQTRRPAGSDGATLRGTSEERKSERSRNRRNLRISGVRSLGLSRALALPKCRRSLSHDRISFRPAEADLSEMPVQITLNRQTRRPAGSDGKTLEPAATACKDAGHSSVQFA